MKKLALIVAWLGFALLLVVISASLLFARQWARERFQTSGANNAWQEWKQETESASDDFDRPVHRRPAVSPLPPTVVLLEEHFWVCWSATALIGGVIYWTFAILLIGAFHETSRFSTDQRVAEP